MAFNIGDYVESMAGYALGKITNIVRINGIPHVTVENNKGQHQNYPEINVRLSKPIEALPTSAIIEASNPGIFDLGHIQIFSLGEHRFILADTENALMSVDILKKWDPEAKILVVHVEGKATFTALEQSVDFQELLERKVAEALKDKRTVRRAGVK